MGPHRAAHLLRWVTGEHSPREGVKSLRLEGKKKGIFQAGKSREGEARLCLPGLLPVSSRESLNYDGCLGGMIGQRPSYFLRRALL